MKQNLFVENDQLKKRIQLLETQSKLNVRINNVYHLFFQVETLNELISKILIEINIEQASSARIVLVENVQCAIKIKTVSGMGIKTDQYAYLDEEIGGQLKDREKLFIPDTSKYRIIKFKPEKLYPRSIIGFSLGTPANYYGYLWFAFDIEKEFSRDEIRNFEKIQSVLSNVIQKFLLSKTNNEKILIYQELLDQIEIPSVVCDSDGKVLISNRLFEDWKIGKNTQSYEDIEKIPAFLYELINTPNGEHLIEENGKLINKIIIVDVKHSGDFIGKLITIYDETENEKSRRLFNLILDILNQDLRSSIIEIQGYTKMLSVIGNLNDQQKRYISNISEKTEYCIQEIEDYLTIDRYSEKEGIRVSQVKITELIETVNQLLGPYAKQNHNDIQLVKEDFEGIVINSDYKLILNAMYYLNRFALVQSGMGGWIKITGEISEGDLIITVNDSSKGLSQREIDDFQTGEFRIENNKELFLVWRIARMLQGNLMVESKFEEGNYYKFRIPADIKISNS